MKQEIFNNIKNIWGWKTNKKILVISVDDYGNVRLDSKSARKKMSEAGLKVRSRFDAFDTLETKEDLEILYDTLSSVKDKNGKYAVITAFTLPCNIDFEKMHNEKYTNFHYELLPATFKKLAAKNPDAYTGAWNLWQEGIEKNIIVPQFHGREHLNITLWMKALQSNKNPGPQVQK